MVFFCSAWHCCRGLSFMHAGRTGRQRGKRWLSLCDRNAASTAGSKLNGWYPFVPLGRWICLVSSLLFRLAEAFPATLLLLRRMCINTLPLDRLTDQSQPSLPSWEIFFLLVLQLFRYYLSWPELRHLPTPFQGYKAESRDTR